MFHTSGTFQREALPILAHQYHALYSKSLIMIKSTTMKIVQDESKIVFCIILDYFLKVNTVFPGIFPKPFRFSATKFWDILKLD